MHRNPFGTVRAVRTDFGDFRKSYYVVDFGARAAVVAVRNRRILLTAQYRHLIDGVAWEIPGGRVDEGESPAKAAVRECAEEAGVRCRRVRRLLTYLPGLDNVDNPTTIFLSTETTDVKSFLPDPRETLAVAWVPLNDCLALIRDAAVCDCVTAMGILAFAASRRLGR